MGEGNNGAAGGTDMTITNEKLEKIAQTLSGDAKSLCKDIAIKLYTNNNFSLGNKSASQYADEAIENALIFINKLLPILSKFD